VTDDPRPSDPTEPADDDRLDESTPAPADEAELDDTTGLAEDAAPSEEAGADTAARRPSTRRSLAIAAAALGALLLLGGWLVSALLPGLLSTPGTPPPAAPPAPPAEARRIQATLFYVSDDGTELVPVSREVLFGDTPLDQARRIAEAQVAPPPEGAVSAIPVGTTVRSLFLTPRGEAYLDLSSEVITGHTGGSLDEALTVYTLVNALIVNLPDVSAVQILVNGKEVDTLVGHLDLRHPLGRALAWVRKAQ
jgi:Sporulation and spore germination